MQQLNENEKSDKTRYNSATQSIIYGSAEVNTGYVETAGTRAE